MAKRKKSRGKKLRGTRSGGSRKVSMGDALMNTAMAGIGGVAGAAALEAADKFGGSITAQSPMISPALVLLTAAGLQMVMPSSKTACAGASGVALAALSQTFMPNGFFGSDSPTPAPAQGTKQVAAYY